MSQCLEQDSQQSPPLCAEAAPDIYAVQVRSSEFLDDLPTQWGRFVEAPTTGAGLSVPQLIVISDGLTPNMDFEALIHDATAHNMTVSAVALGKDADRTSMDAIAHWGHGRSYYRESGADTEPPDAPYNL